MTRDQFIASSYSHRRPYRRSCCGSSAQDADTNMAQFIGFGTKKKQIYFYPSHVPAFPCFVSLIKSPIVFNFYVFCERSFVERAQSQ